ncbi:MAG: hypothetical protein AB7O79_07330 [Xanthobacteraceae bacterium]
MSNPNRTDRTSAERRRALRRAERDDLMRIFGDEQQMDTPDAAAICMSSRDAQDTRPNDPRSSL